MPTSTDFMPTSFTSTVNLRGSFRLLHFNAGKPRSKIWNNLYRTWVLRQRTSGQQSKTHVETKSLQFQDDVNLPKHFVKEFMIIEVKNCIPAVPPGKYDIR